MRLERDDSELKAIGLLLFAFYRPFEQAGYADAAVASFPFASPDRVFPDFITKAMPPGLAGLRTVFRADGVVTAGNSSQISDGAAALLVMTSEVASRHGWRPVRRRPTAR